MPTIGERSRVRWAHLDNLRTLLVAWVIGGHALLGYSAVGGWAYDEVSEVRFAPTTELVLVAILGPSGLFVIGVFFFLAGLLTERALARHGPRQYVHDRVLRLGLPWLVSALLVWPASVWLAYHTAGRRVSFWWVAHPSRPASRFRLALVRTRAAAVLGGVRTVASAGRGAPPPARSATDRGPPGRCDRSHHRLLVRGPPVVSGAQRPDRRPAPVAVASVRRAVRARRGGGPARLGPTHPGPPPPRLRRADTGGARPAAGARRGQRTPRRRARRRTLPRRLALGGARHRDDRGDPRGRRLRVPGRPRRTQALRNRSARRRVGGRRLCGVRDPGSRPDGPRLRGPAARCTGRAQGSARGRGRDRGVLLARSTPRFPAEPAASSWPPAAAGRSPARSRPAICCWARHFEPPYDPPEAP